MDSKNSIYLRKISDGCTLPCQTALDALSDQDLERASGTNLPDTANHVARRLIQWSALRRIQQHKPLTRLWNRLAQPLARHPVH